MPSVPVFEEVPFVAAMCDADMSHTIKMYQEHGLDRPRFFQARDLMQYLIVIFGRVPLPPNGNLTPYLSMTSSTLPIPHHNVGPRPSDAVFFEACRQIAPGVNFEIDTKNGSPPVVHGFEITPPTEPQP